MLDTTLIQKALALTNTPMEEMEIDEWVYQDGDQFHGKYFSIEKFCYYLFSPGFIEKYMSYCTFNNRILEHSPQIDIICNIGEAICLYQKGNEQPLSDLLSKI